MAQRRWRRVRIPLAAFVLIVLAVIGTVLLEPRVGAGALDPTSPAPDGSRAVAQVLQGQGIEVTTVATADAAQAAGGGGSTLLVVRDELLTPALLAELTGYADTVVLVEPGGVTLEELGAPLVPDGRGDLPADPACDLPAARAAGPVENDSTLYRVTSGGSGEVVLCYPQDRAIDDDEPVGGIAVWEHDRGRLVVLGSRELLTNDDVDEPGHAALALRTLGSRDQLVWWMVSPNDPALLDGPRVSPLDLLPPWVPLVGWQLALTTLALSWWRGRRLGRLVPEPLPVVVRSAETTHGRAALYRRAGARDRAATVLRARAVGTAGHDLGLAASASPPELVAAVAHATGRPSDQVHHTLFGPAPRTDAELTALADELDGVLGSLHSSLAARPFSHQAPSHHQAPSDHQRGPTS